MLKKSQQSSFAFDYPFYLIVLIPRNRQFQANYFFLFFFSSTSSSSSFFFFFFFFFFLSPCFRVFSAQAISMKPCQLHELVNQHNFPHIVILGHTTVYTT